MATVLPLRAAEKSAVECPQNKRSASKTVYPPKKNNSQALVFVIIIKHGVLFRYQQR